MTCVCRHLVAVAAASEVSCCKLHREEEQQTKCLACSIQHNTVNTLTQSHALPAHLVFGASPYALPLAAAAAGSLRRAPARAAAAARVASAGGAGLVLSFLTLLQRQHSEYGCTVGRLSMLLGLLGSCGWQPCRLLTCSVPARPSIDRRPCSFRVHAKHDGLLFAGRCWAAMPNGRACRPSACSIVHV